MSKKPRRQSRRRKETAPSLSGLRTDVEKGLLSREVVAADRDKVVWVETWNLDHPRCPYAPNVRCMGSLFMVEKVASREEFEDNFGSVRDKRVH
jgi:hypothetical protein